MEAKRWVRRRECPCGEPRCCIRSQDGDGDEDDEGASSTTSVAQPFVARRFTPTTTPSNSIPTLPGSMGLPSEERLPRVLRVSELTAGSWFVSAPASLDIVNLQPQTARRIASLHCVATGPQWAIKRFSINHNHELPKHDQLRLLPAYRKISEADRQRILLLRRAGYSTSHIMKILGSEKGGDSAKLQFLDRDVRNFIQSSTKKIDQGIDAQELFNMCKNLKENFSYEFILDDDDKLGSLAWTCGDSVRAYQAFGDVVVFDITFRETTYDKVFGIWFGIDNHGKFVLFGAALLQDESSGSVTWALQTFLRLMKGRPPQTVLNDFGFGLRDAIVSELPNTKHTNGTWHIFSKLSSWFYQPLGSQYEEFKSEFSRVYISDTVKDFEYQWNEMVYRYGLNSNNHVALLYAHRMSWALPYVKGYFHAGMTRFECSKWIDEFLKEILSEQSRSENIFEKVDGISSGGYKGQEEENENVHIKLSCPWKNMLPAFSHLLLSICYSKKSCCRCIVQHLKFLMRCILFVTTSR